METVPTIGASHARFVEPRSNGSEALQRKNSSFFQNPHFYFFLVSELLVESGTGIGTGTATELLVVIVDISEVRREGLMFDLTLQPRSGCVFGL